MNDGIKFCNSHFWDTNLTWQSSSPDFTQCFQNTVLSWSPLAILLLLLPYEYYQIQKAKKWKVEWELLNVLSCVSILLLILLNLTLFVNSLVTLKQHEVVYLADVTSPFIVLLSQILALIVRLNGQRHGILSSAALFWFWLASTVCEVIKYRTTILQILGEELPDEYEEYIVKISCILSIFPLTLLVFMLTFLPDNPEIGPYYKTTEIDDAGIRRNRASYVSRILHTWIFPLVYSGYKTTMTEDQIWRLEEQDHTHQLYKKFEDLWKKSHSKNNNKKKGSKSPTLEMALLKIFGATYFASYFMRICADLVQFLSPIILNEMIVYVGRKDEPLWKGIALSVALTLTVMTRMCFISNFFMVAFSTALRTRTVLTAAVFHKSLRMSNTAKQRFSVGGMVNLISVDTQKFIDLLPYLPQFINAPIIITIAIIMLWHYLGVACLSGLVILAAFMPINAGLSTINKSLQNRTMTLSDSRLKIINEILMGMKVLKLYSWEIPFAEEIRKIRKKEIQSLAKYAYLTSIITSLWTCTPIFMATISFATFVLMSEDNIMTAQNAFVSITLFNIVRVPMITLPRAISSAVEVYVALKRLNCFMNAAELDPEAVDHSFHSKTAVKVGDGCFSWAESDDELILKDINVSVKHGELVAIVGRVGAGKSSLLSALLGDMTKQRGFVNVQGKLAYVPQQAWIQNATVKDNITFYKPVDEVRYQQVVYASALLPDFQLFIAGDKTEIGEKGVNLSGGQKQRVSIARSVYYDADVYIMDDPLSAVDAHVGKHIFEQIIGPTGLLSKKTRIISTNSLSFLSKCDNIVVMKDGRVSEFGSYNQLLKNDGDFSELILNYIQEAGDQDDDHSDTNEVIQMLENIDLPETFRKKLSVSRSMLSDTESVDVSVSVKSSSRKIDHEKHHSTAGRLVEIEAVEVGGVKFSVYWNYMKQMGLFVTMASTLSWTLFIVFIVTCNIWLSEWTDDSLNPNIEDVNLQTRFRLGIYALLGLLQVVALTIGLCTLSYGSLNATKSLHSSMLNSILHSPMSFFDTTPIGRIINRFSKDVNIMDVTLLSYLNIFLSFASNVIASLSVIVIESPIILVTFPLLFGAFFYIQRVYLKSSRQIKRIESVTRSPINSLFSEIATGTTSIRAYDVAHIITKEFYNRLDRNQMAYYSSIIVTRWLESTVLFIVGFIIATTSIFAAVNKDVIGPGAAGLTISFAINITGMILFSIQSTADVETNIVSGERIMEYTNLTPEADWNIDETKPGESWPQHGRVVFDKYEAKYRPELDLVLKGIDCNIEPGEKIGICGRTGAGKSSLTLALFRIIEKASGSIQIDGVDISTLGLNDLRSKLTIIPQDPVLFTGNLRFNLDPFNNYTDVEIWNSLELAHLKEFTRGLSEGLDYFVSEGGENISVGQRQLVCLARALLRKTKVLVLDEATAAVDLETDDLIQATIRKEFTDCTVITIAHRLNTIMDSTRVMVLSDGLIVEFDSPDNLLRDTDSAFSKMLEDS